MLKHDGSLMSSQKYVVPLSNRFAVLEDELVTCDNVDTAEVDERVPN